MNSSPVNNRSSPRPLPSRRWWDAEAAAYTLTEPRSAPVLGPYRARIAAMLAENAHLPPKQRQTSHTMFVRLWAEGYRGSESNVRTFLAQLRRDQHKPKLFLPLEFDPGTDAQVDWGEADVIMQGVQQTVQIFVMRPILPPSNCIT